jgi:hypothetical protein
MAGRVKGTLLRYIYGATVTPLVCPAASGPYSDDKPQCLLLRPDGTVGFCPFYIGIELRSRNGWDRREPAEVVTPYTGPHMDSIEASYTLCLRKEAAGTPPGADMQ